MSVTHLLPASVSRAIASHCEPTSQKDYYDAVFKIVLRFIDVSRNGGKFEATIRLKKTEFNLDNISEPLSRIVEKLFEEGYTAYLQNNYPNTHLDTLLIVKW